MKSKFIMKNNDVNFNEYTSSQRKHYTQFNFDTLRNSEVDTAKKMTKTLQSFHPIVNNGFLTTLESVLVFQDQLK